MIVDDQEFLQKVTASIIEKIRITLFLNFEIVTAINGEEAVQKYLQNPREYKLIFMDIQMPILNGY
jgi:CheY-like chemotaxis protein